jgi:hypothetical protein
MNSVRVCGVSRRQRHPAPSEIVQTNHLVEVGHSFVVHGGSFSASGALFRMEGDIYLVMSQSFLVSVTDMTLSTYEEAKILPLQQWDRSFECHSRMYVYVRLFCICVVLYIGSDLTTG